MGISTRPAEILFVEDSAADVRLAREALATEPIATRLHVVGDGEAALAFLDGDPPFEDAPEPDLILLDLHLPKVDGSEVLAELKCDDRWRNIPVVVLTSLSFPGEFLDAYDLRADFCITKSHDLDEFADQLHAALEFCVVPLEAGRDRSTHREESAWERPGHLPAERSQRGRRTRRPDRKTPKVGGMHQRHIKKIR